MSLVFMLVTAAVGFFGVHLVLFYASSRWLWLPQISLDLVLRAIGFLLLRHWFGEDYQLFDEFQMNRRKGTEPA